MAIRVEQLSHLDLTVFVVEQEASVHEQLAVLENFYEQGPSHNVLWDLTDMTGPRPNVEEMHAIVALLNRYRHVRQSGRTAFVGRQDIDFGVARMGTMLAETKGLSRQFEVFRTREDALGWLVDEANGQGVDAGA